MALFRADIAGILTVRTFKMLFQIVFRESGLFLTDAADSFPTPDSRKTFWNSILNVRTVRIPAMSARKSAIAF